jgi:hypothetical protein
MKQSYKDVLSNAQSALLLTEVLADQEKVEMRADVIEMYPVTATHQAMVQEILEEKLILQKPQSSAGEYVTTTNRRGGGQQIIASKKETPWSYEGIDIV